MKTVGTILVAALVLLPWCAAPLLAQDSTPAGEKKIMITKRTVDADGTETTETIIKKGKAAENFDVDQYIEDNRADNVQLNVRVVDGDENDESIVIKRTKNHDFDWDFNFDHNVSMASCDDNRAFLGVEEDSDEDSDEPGLVVEVIRGSAADKAGLRTNDVILKLNGTAVNEWDELAGLIGDAKPGDQMQIAYSRNGNTATTTATLTTRAEATNKHGKEPHGFLGISPANEDDDDNNVTIDVIENSAAEKAGLQDGDILLRLNDAEIRDWEDITDVMSYTSPGETMKVTYQRNGQTNTVGVVLGEPKQKAALVSVDKWVPKDLHINVREKAACLGVYTSAFGEGDRRGSRISDFTEESAARESGMATDDVITAVNGVRVESHDQLWDEIAKYHPGDKVSVDFLHENQPKQIEATLKACRDNSNRVMIFDDNDSQKNREFFLWNWDKTDQDKLREHRVITIRRGAEGDAPAPEAAPANTPAPDRSLKLEGFRAYPNPSQGQVSVEFHSEPLPTIVSLLDMSGRQLFREELNAFNGDYFQQFDLSEYAKGAIVIQVLQGNKVFTEQIVVN